MAKKGLGRGLGAIFGTEVNKTAERKPHHRKTVAESIAEAEQVHQAEENGGAHVDRSAVSADEQAVSAIDAQAGADAVKAENTVAEHAVFKGSAAADNGNINSAADTAKTNAAAFNVQTTVSGTVSGNAATETPKNIVHEGNHHKKHEGAVDGTAAPSSTASVESAAEHSSANSPAANAPANSDAEYPDAKDLVLKTIRLSLIQPNLSQPRKNFDEESLVELANSIREYGVLQPLIVKQQGLLYEIIAGERRWRAAKLAGLKEVPALVKELSDQASREISIIENIQRADLNAVEEALAYQSLLSEYGMTQEELAARVSKKRSTITNSLRLLKLEPELLDMLRDGKITQGHARALLAVEDKELRKKIAERCEKENLSVREIETLVRLDKLSKSKKRDENTEEALELRRLKLLYKDLERRMKSRLGTKVSIVPKDKNKGVLEIEYYSQDELDRIFTMLNSVEADV